MAANGQLDYRPKPGSVPDSPGVYRFRDELSTVIYVGKARSLRSRLSNYFADSSALHPRTYAMVNAATSVDWVTVANEVEALQLEYSWIKQYDPRFNVRYRDDKSYPYLAVTLNERFPRVLVMRGDKKPGVRYFGPFAHAWAIRETVDQLLRVFPMRSCSKGVFQRHERMGRPCLLGDIGKCSAPCVKRVSEEAHRAIAEDLCKFMGGRTEAYIKGIERKMQQAAGEQDYERAARLRDDLAALRRALARSAVVLPDDVDADVIGLEEDELEAALQVFYVRGGRVTGQHGFIVERTVDTDVGAIVEQFITRLYGEADGDQSSGPPRQIYLSHEPVDKPVLALWLAGRRGSKVKISVPSRGAKRDLMATVVSNAKQSLAMHKVRRAGDLTARSQSLEELQNALGLADAPLRIECIDISGHHGTDMTASIVVFEDASPKKSEYRKYAIADHQDDLAAMYEAVTRRYSRLAPHRVVPAPDAKSDSAAESDSEADSDSESRRADPNPQRFRYRPGLLVVDGGAPQVGAASAALGDLGIDFIAVCGLAKRLEEVWLPDQADPVILPRRSEGLYLLQRVRDEAHRFAITYHRKRREMSSRASALDEIAGLGPARKKALVRHFGSVRNVRAATALEIAAVPGIGTGLASTIAAALKESPEPAGINLTTGEIVDHAGQS